MFFRKCPNWKIVSAIYFDKAEVTRFFLVTKLNLCFISRDRRLMCSPLFPLLDHVCVLFSHSGHTSAPCASNYKCRRLDVDQSYLWHLKVSPDCRNGTDHEKQTSSEAKVPCWQIQNLGIRTGLLSYTNLKISQVIRSSKIQEIRSNLGKLFANKSLISKPFFYSSDLSISIFPEKQLFLLKWFIEYCPQGDIYV